MEYEESELPLLAELRPGAAARKVGRYTVLRKLATGGMAAVYLAHLTGEHQFQKFVAIKCPHPNLLKNPAILGMFLNEARLLAQLEHENICPIIDFGADKKGPYIVMPYLHGHPLGEIMQHYASRPALPIPFDLMAYIAAAVCDGLFYAHNVKVEGKPLGLVHRDISPHNIFISFEGGVKILDFGVAKAIGLDGFSVAGQPKGKYAYMSPEQVRGEALDHRSDLFSLGTVLWESIAGRRLFRRESPAMTLFAIEQGQTPSIQEVAPECPHELATIVMKALSRSRGDRFASAREMGRELRRYLARREALLSPTEVSSIMRESFPSRAADRDPLASITEPRAQRPSDAPPPPEVSEPSDQQPDPALVERLDRLQRLERLGSGEPEELPSNLRRPDDEPSEPSEHPTRRLDPAQSAIIRAHEYEPIVAQSREIFFGPPRHEHRRSSVARPQFPPPLPAATDSGVRAPGSAEMTGDSPTTRIENKSSALDNVAFTPRVGPIPEGEEDTMYLEKRASEPTRVERSPRPPPLPSKPPPPPASPPPMPPVTGSIRVGPSVVVRMGDEPSYDTPASIAPPPPPVVATAIAADAAMVDPSGKFDTGEVAASRATVPPPALVERTASLNDAASQVSMRAYSDVSVATSVKPPPMRGLVFGLMLFVGAAVLAFLAMTAAK